MSGGLNPSSRRAAWLEPLVVGGLAVLLLVVSAPAFRTGFIYLTEYLNDQVGYITTARWLADTGELRSHLIYPAYADQPHWRLYMPGHYYALAAVFKLLGYGPLLARVPCLVAFVIGVVGLFLIGRRLYGPTAGLVAAALFAILPAQGFFAFTAMADMTVTASVVVAFLLFVYLPERWRGWCVPLLLVGPFLFRETTALAVIPLSLLTLGTPPGRRWGAFLFAAVGSVVLLGLVNRWQVACGKEPTPLTWVSEGSFNYADATLRDAPSPTLPEFLAGVRANLANNASLLAERYGSGLLDSVEPLSTAALLLGAGYLLVAGYRRRRRDLLPLAAGLLAATAAVLTVLLYSVWGFRLLRMLHLTMPFLLVGLGALASERLGSRRPDAGRARLAGFALGALVLGYGGMRLSAASIQMRNPKRLVERIEAIDHDDTTVLVAAHSLVFDYVLAHYPVRYSFRPANEETLFLLSEHYEIGTVIATRTNLRERYSEEALERIGLRRLRRLEEGETKPWIFQ